MKHIIYMILSALILAVAVSCDKKDLAAPSGGDPGGNGPGGNDPGIPEGWFVATFTPGSGTRAPVSGPDNRVQHLRYMVFDAIDGGSFVKEREIEIEPNQQWPLAGDAITDTLPVGTYMAVFVANADPSLFSLEGSEPFELLTGYREGYSSGRIHLPPVEFTPDTEYYMAQALFSDTEPASEILLQRIIGRTKLKRITVDAQDALNTLVENLLTNINYEGLLRETVDGILQELLPGLIGDTVAAIANPLTTIVDGLLGIVLNPILTTIVDPITETLYEMVVKELVNHIGEVLELNTDGEGLAYLTSPLLNPWGTANAASALVTISDFPESVDFGLTATEFFPSGQRFKYNFNTLDPEQEHYVTIKGFGGDYNVERINVLSNGSLIGGVVVTEVVDDFLLTGTFIDVDDPATLPQATNISIQRNYSLVGLGVSDDDTTGDPYPFSTTIRLGDIANLDGILHGALDGLGSGIDLLLTPIRLALALLGISLSAVDIIDSIIDAILDSSITVTLPIDLPVLGIDNLSLSGSWGATESWNGD